MPQKSTLSTTRAAIYTRVSSSLQEQDGTSLDSQLSACRAYCDTHGYTIIEEYSDTHTGSEYRQRPGLSAMRELVRSGHVDVVVCYALDRLSRHQTHTAVLVDEIEHYRGRVELVTESFEDSAAGRFIRSARAFVAETEREKLVERTTRGRQARVSAGKPLAAGRPLYGYRWRDDEKSALDIDPVNGPVARSIFEDMAQGTSLRGVAMNLHERELPTPTGKGTWRPTTIRNLVKNPAYKGEAYGWCWRPAIEQGKRAYFDTENAIRLPDGAFSAIVDASTWQAVQVRLDRNKHAARVTGANREVALLRGGYVRCGYCGSVAVVHRHSGGKWTYRCRNISEVGGCSMAWSIQCDRLDGEVWERAKAVLTQPGIIQRELDRMTAEDPTRGNLEAVERSLKEHERREVNLIIAISLVGPDAQAPLAAELNRLMEGVTQLHAEKQAILNQREGWLHAQTLVADLESWCEGVAARIETLDYDGKRLALEALGVEVVVRRKGDLAGRWQITAKMPFGEDTLGGREYSITCNCTRRRNQHPRRQTHAGAPRQNGNNPSR